MAEPDAGVDVDGDFSCRCLFFAGMLTLEYERSWTAAERLYLSDYLKSGARGKASATAQSKYTLLEAVVGKGAAACDRRRDRAGAGAGRQAGIPADGRGREGRHLAADLGDGRLQRPWSAPGDERGGVRKSRGCGTSTRSRSICSLAFFVLALFVAVPKDRARRMIWKHGRRLRGPELVTTAEFNTKLGQSKRLTTYLPDGVTFINEERRWCGQDSSTKTLSRWARVPREREAMHFLIVGDSGTGKSAAIRQMLAQIWERGEAAIVYDPAMEYLPQFYTRVAGRRDPESVGRAVSVLDSGRRGSARSGGPYLSRSACSRTRAGRTGSSSKRRGKSSLT